MLGPFYFHNDILWTNIGMESSQNRGYFLIVHGEQIRAARSLLGWSQSELAEKAGVGQMTVKRLEAKTGAVGGTVDSLIRVQSALEKAGMVFIAADEQGGVGVRLAKHSVG